MCGLVGIATNDFKPVEFDMLRTGLYLMQTRGSQGTGVGIIKEKGYIDIIKDGGSAIEFIQKDGFLNLMSLSGKVIAMGHTRQPVYGGSGKKCAHPFRINNTVLAHNGLMQNYNEITTRYNLKPTTKNDTEVLTIFLDRYGIKKMSEWVGTFALTFYHRKRLYLYKDEDGELFLADIEHKNGKHTFFWASDWAAIKFILLQEGLEAPIYSLAPSKLWSVSLEGFPDVRIEQVSTILKRWEYNKSYQENYMEDGTLIPKDRAWVKDGDMKSYDYDQYYHKCDWCGAFVREIIYHEEFDSWLCENCEVICEGEQDLERFGIIGAGQKEPAFPTSEIKQVVQDYIAKKARKNYDKDGGCEK